MTMTDPKGNGDRAEVARLTEAITRLNKSTVQQMVRQAKMSKTNRKLIWALAIFSGVIVLLIAALGVGFHSLSKQADDMDKITARLDNAQSEQRQKGLCPLYTL